MSVVSSKQDADIDTFKASVESNSKQLLNTYKEELPETWANIRTRVAERCENKEKTLTFADFKQICLACKLVGTPSVILGYLHRAGVVFYYEKQFDNQIILDQEWALKAVYAVLKFKPQIIKSSQIDKKSHPEQSEWLFYTSQYKHLFFRKKATSKPTQ